MTLLGRGSGCINTGGEKVFPEEVEEALKLFPGILDAVVVGAPHERFGQQVIAFVEPDAGVVLDLESVGASLQERLAGYKVPRRIVVVESIGRAANGKVDQGRWRAEATTLGSASS